MTKEEAIARYLEIATRQDELRPQIESRVPGMHDLLQEYIRIGEEAKELVAKFNL